MVVHDELENNWGTQVFLNEPIRTPNKSMVQFDALVRQSVKGFKLFKVQSAGTYANMIAVEDATEYNIDSALYAVGSYVGGDQYSKVQLVIQSCGTDFGSETHYLYCLCMTNVLCVL